MFFYCRSYCLPNMFRAPLCISSGAREYYTSGCCLSYLVLGFQVVGMVWSWGLWVRFAGCSPQTGLTTCLASNKICNKIHLLRLVGILFPHINVITFGSVGTAPRIINLGTRRWSPPLSGHFVCSVNKLRAMACLEAVARRDISAYAGNWTPVDQPVEN